MPNRKFAVLLAALLLTFLLAGCSQDAPVFRIGYMICNSPEESKGRFEGLTAYLSKATGAKFESVYLDTMDFEDAYLRGDFDFTHSNSLIFAALSKKHGTKLLVSERRGAFGSKTRGTIIVRQDSPIKTIEDLRGKRLIFGPQWAPYGFLSQYALMLEKGVDPEKDLGPYSFPQGTWKHEKIIYSVLYGAYDAGAAPLIDLEEMTAEGKVAPNDFRVIAKSDLAPYCTFGVSPKVEEKWAGAVKKALLAADAETTAETGGETVKILKRAQIDGFDELPLSEYDILLRWAKAAKMPPYEEY
ncbi:phosphate/phosphite/phosphonate ABC transporter substrate-binding protein [bacterium]|nr:MAG: phosphate/phosphite/phosphonate ABC transporter substrate-binding protein [bacterium]